MVPPRTFQPDGRAQSRDFGDRTPAKRPRLRYGPNMTADPCESVHSAHGAYVATAGFPDTFRAQRIAFAELSTQLTFQNGSLAQTEKTMYGASMDFETSSSPSVNVRDMTIDTYESSPLATPNTLVEPTTEQTKESEKGFQPLELRDIPGSLVCFGMASMITTAPNSYPDSSIDLWDGC
jgi:hypothetical protein